MSDILNNDYIDYDRIIASVTPTEKELEEFGVNRGDILFQRSSETLEDVGRANVYLDDRTALFGGFVIRGKKKEEYEPYFMRYALSSPVNRKKVIVKGAGAQHFNIGQDGLSKVSISVSTIDEQTKIGALLRLIDERIATQNKIIEDLKKLKSAIYDVVFSSLTGRLASLGDVAEIIKGKQVNGEFLSDDGEYYVMNGGVEPSGYYHSFNTPANTISISEGGNSCGYIQWNNSSFWSGGHCYTLRILDSNMENKYLYHLLKWREVEIMKLRIGTGLPNIQKKELAKVSVFLPSSAIQNKVISLLDSIDNKINIEINLSFLFLRQKAYLLSKMFI